MDITDVRVRKIAADGKAAEGDFKDIAHPIKTEMREKIARLILEKYNSEE